ncbi:hypothetical protein HDK90DRAFT_249518 [Phyllosticta capitalensis]|uniref:Uncharacterized protein n=1 Tax=Phyllosticta capitalensis TaxID=121624 RepID=A0ABR1YQR1_9PEZI
MQRAHVLNVAVSKRRVVRMSIRLSNPWIPEVHWPLMQRGETLDLNTASRPKSWSMPPAKARWCPEGGECSMLLLFILALSQHQASVLHLERHQQPFYAVFYSQTQCRRTSPSHANSGDSSKTNQVSLLQTDGKPSVFLSVPMPGLQSPLSYESR